MKSQGEGEYGKGGGGGRATDTMLPPRSAPAEGSEIESRRLGNETARSVKRSQAPTAGFPDASQPPSTRLTQASLRQHATSTSLPVNEITIQCDFLPLFKQSRRVMSWILDLSFGLVVHRGTCGGNSTALAEPATNRLLPNL